MSRSQAHRRILGIETSTRRCEVALADDRSIVAAATLEQGAKPTAALVPAIRDLARQVGWSLRELDLVCVDIGPGSYTGLRVGLTCAKSLAFVAGARLVPVGSLDVVALNVSVGESMLDVCFDAARGQLFTARFHRVHQKPTWTPIEPVRILEVDAWAKQIDERALVLGPALEKIRQSVGVRRIAEESMWWPRGSNVIELGRAQIVSNLTDSYWSLEPLYMRLSAAEEKKADTVAESSPISILRK